MVNEWIVEMPDGTFRAGVTWFDYRGRDGPRQINPPPKEGRHITKAEFDRKTLPQPVFYTRRLERRKPLDK